MSDAPSARRLDRTGHPTQPVEHVAGVFGQMEAWPLTVEELFERDYARLVKALAVAFDAESAADAVQEAFISADRKWRTVSRYADPAGWVRRVALNRLLNGRRNRRRQQEILATISPVTIEDLTDARLDGADLTLLAPEVDEGRSRELFERRRA